MYFKPSFLAHPRLAALGVAFVLWALVGWVVIGGVLKYYNMASWQPVSAVSADLGLPASDGVAFVASALGAQTRSASETNAEAVPVVASDYVLQGVIASASSLWGAAIILRSQDKAAKVYALGTELDGRWRIHRIEPRRVVLQSISATAQSPTLELTLPPVKTAAQHQSWSTSP